MITTILPLFQPVALDWSSLQHPPLSTLVIFLISAALGLATTLANRLMMNISEFKKFTVESTYARQDMMAAVRSGNQRLIAKAQKQQQEMMKTQQKMTMDRMKITLFFFIPFILIWQVLGNFFQGTIAYMPFEAPWIGRELSVSSWYFLCSISTNIIISRILGLTFEIEPRKLQ